MARASPAVGSLHLSPAPPFSSPPTCPSATREVTMKRGQREEGRIEDEQEKREGPLGPWAYVEERSEDEMCCPLGPHYF